MAAKANQVGGNHYSRLSIQPMEYALANNFNYCESLVLRYLSRHRRKAGREDIEKAIHCLELLMDHEYGGNKEMREMQQREEAR